MEVREEDATRAAVDVMRQMDAICAADAVRAGRIIDTTDTAMNARCWADMVTAHVADTTAIVSTTAAVGLDSAAVVTAAAVDKFD